MAEWRYPLPLQPPPGPVEPLPNLDTPAWDAWAYDVARREAATVPGARTPPDFVLKMTVTPGPWIWMVRSGEDPGPWEDDHATVETLPPADYQDWRRFRRVYPRVTYYEGREVAVVLEIQLPPAAGTHFRHFLFHEIRSGPTVAHNVVQHYWMQTSWVWRDAMGAAHREENWDALKTAPARIPANGDLPSVPTPRPRELEERTSAIPEDEPAPLKPKIDWRLEAKVDWSKLKPDGFLHDWNYSRSRTAEEMRRRLGQNPKPPRPREMDYDGDADEATLADKKSHGH